MDKLKFFSFGPKLYNKLIITFPQLSTLMFQENVSEISNLNTQSTLSGLNNFPLIFKESTTNKRNLMSK
jgi:hypothetical protein